MCLSVFVHGMFCQAIDTFVAFKLLSYKAQNGGKCQQPTTATTTHSGKQQQLQQQQQLQRQLHFAEKGKNFQRATAKVS